MLKLLCGLLVCLSGAVSDAISHGVAITTFSMKR